MPHPSPTQDLLLDLMRKRQGEKPQPSQAELAREIGCSKQFVNTRFARLKARGAIYITKANRWRVK